MRAGAMVIAAAAMAAATLLNPPSRAVAQAADDATAPANAANAATSPAPTNWPAASQPAFSTTAPTTAPAATRAFDSLVMSATHCVVWREGTGRSTVNVVELLGAPRQKPTLVLGDAHLSADAAVVWIAPAPAGRHGQQLTIALLGDARLQQGSILRIDHQLMVTANVEGKIRLVGERTAKQDIGSPLYQRAVALRRGAAATRRSQRSSTTEAATQATTEAATEATTESTTQATTTASTQASTLPTTQSASRPWFAPPPSTAPTLATAPATLPPPTRFLEFSRVNEQTERDDHGNLAFVLTGGDITLRYGNDKGDLLEFQADRIVLFTDLKTMHGMGGAGAEARRLLSEHVQALYCEGDVRVSSVSATPNRPELRMTANRIYYDLKTDRAVMTDAIFHAVDMQKQVPIFMRAQVLRQLSDTEFSAQGVQLTTSGFATPTYALGASQAYVHVEATGDATEGDRITFNANDTTFTAEGVPIFYLPAVGGTMTSRGGALQEASIVSSSNFGYGVHTVWGLFQTLGKVPPKDVDVSYTLDYFSDRGPAGGVDAKYVGGLVDDTTKQPFSFSGDLHAYLVDDHGTDVLGGIRPDITPPTQFRGRVVFDHQDFFPDDWQSQIRLGWVSDANFLTQWFTDEFFTDLPIDEEIYLKHQQADETFSLLAQWQPNAVVTTSDMVPAQREVNHLPQITYDREGDSLLDNHATLFSETSLTGLKFVSSKQSLADQGFIPGFGPGLSSIAYTGDPGDYTGRADTRQEIDLPLSAGPLKVVPYAFGRYTVYTQGVVPVGDPSRFTQKNVPGRTFVNTDWQNRVMAGGGVRISTELWKTDNSAESDLFDIHRLRHIIEPELDLFASAQNIDQDRLFIYDPDVDAINDVQAMQLALRQRWQTKRGGPGRWRSVDFLTWDVYADLFANQPDPRFRDPTDFRGLFIAQEPEFSLPRNSINSDALWRVSDTTALLADISHNLDAQKLATAGMGLAVQRGDGLNYNLGVRYIADLDSTFASGGLYYDLTRKYNVGLGATIDLTQARGITYTASITRKFDRFALSLRVYYDQIANDSGFSFSFQPYGFGRGIGTQNQTIAAPAQP